MKRSLTICLSGFAALVALGAACAPVSAQTTYYACRVPSVGAIYMVADAVAPCLDAAHVKFSWEESGTVADGSITTAKLADQAVTTAKLADGSATVAKLAFDPATQTELDALSSAGTINTSTNPVDWSQLKGVPAGFADGVDDAGAAGPASDVVCAQCVGTTDIATSAVTAALIATDAVGAAEIVAGAVGSAEVLDNSLTAADLAASSVTNSELADNSVTGAKIVDGTITGADIATNTITATQIAASAVGTSEIANGSVAAADLASSVVTARGLAAVSSTGTLLRGANATAASRTGLGTYTVTFNFTITTGYYFVTTGLTSTCAAGHSVEDSTSTSVFVLFVDDGGTRIDCNFSLVVF